MSGYYLHSKSNNAVLAEKNGEFPYSVWTKSMILKKIKKYYGDYELAKKVPADILKCLFLVRVGWHHTGKYFRKTDYYEFDSLRDDVSAEWFEKVIYIHKNKLSFFDNGIF